MFGGVLFMDKIKANNIEIKMKAGTISGFPSAKLVRAKLAFGDIHLHHLEGSADLSLGAGDLKLVFNKIGKDSKINLSCKLGDIQLMLPKGSIFSAAEVAKDGQIKNKAGAKISLKTWLGSLKVEENG
jgi:DUF4097 and DUF4098 domain-containing protein YvlB